MPFNGMLYPTDLAVSVSAKAERCQWALAKAHEHTERRVIYEQSICFQKLEHAKEAAHVRERILEDKPLPYWALAVAYVSGIVTVVLGAWVASEVRR